MSKLQSTPEALQALQPGVERSDTPGFPQKKTYRSRRDRSDTRLWL